MRKMEITLLMAGVIVFLFGLSHEASAKGGGTPPCVEDSKFLFSGGSLQGTGAVLVTGVNGTTGTGADATLRLQWKGTERVYRVHVPGPVGIFIDELTCAILAADPVDMDNGVTLSEVVGVSPVDFKITDNSFTGLNWNTFPGGYNTTGSAITQIKIFVLH